MSETREEPRDPQAKQAVRNKKRVSSWIRLHVDEKTDVQGPEKTPRHPSEKTKSEPSESGAKEPAEA